MKLQCGLTSDDVGLESKDGVKVHRVFRSEAGELERRVWEVNSASSSESTIELHFIAATSGSTRRAIAHPFSARSLARPERTVVRRTVSSDFDAFSTGKGWWGDLCLEFTAQTLEATPRLTRASEFAVVHEQAVADAARRVVLVAG